MAIYYAPFSAISVSAAQDLWEVVAPSNSYVRLKEVRFGQYSDAGDAEAEILSVTFVRGDTVSGSGGSTITPVPVWPGPTQPTAGTTVERNNTTVANTSGAVIWADAWNVQTPFLYLPEADAAIVIKPSQRLCVRITAPGDAITMNGVLTFEEIGKSP